MGMVLGSTLLLSGVTAAHGQWPGEIHGQIVDSRTGEGVAGARITLDGGAHSTLSTTDGHFRLRPVPPGGAQLRISRAGYRTVAIETEVQTGMVRSLLVDLDPEVVELEGIMVEGVRAPSSPFRIDRQAIQRSGAATLGGILEGVPDLTVIRRGLGGEETVTIRGAPPGGTLVLVDGVPLNDPVTGVADVGSLRAGRVASVEVLPGARGARFGPGALGGVILVRTDRAGTGAEAVAGAGTLGQREGALSGVIPLGSMQVVGGIRHARLEGGFDFERGPDIGGGRATRQNADLREQSLRVALRPEGTGGESDWEVSLDLDELERGIPGKSYAPSRHARQETGRSRIGLRLERPLRLGTSPVEFRARAGLERRTLHSLDPAPPLGLPYDQHTRAGHRQLEVELDGIRMGRERIQGGAGASARRVTIDSDLLHSAPARIVDAGAFFHIGTTSLPFPLTPQIRGAARVDRSRQGGIAVSHEAGVEGGIRGVRIHLAHRTAYRPPTPADQFFREGVGIEPNPDLRAERIPGELEIGAHHHRTLGSLDLRANASLFRGDIDDHIVWQPDFRFVWSPRNVDIRRRGGSAHFEVRHDSGLQLRGHWTRAQVTYRRSAGERPPSQLAYRPIHSGTVAIGWRSTPVQIEVASRYTGARYPVPAPVNELPGFWATDLVLSGSLSGRGWSVEPTLKVDRLLGVRDPFIASIPEPGRTVRFEVGLRRSTESQNHGVQP